MGTYRALPNNLTEVADATQRYLKDELGLNSIEIEREIDQRIDFRPTLQSLSPDKHIVCVEVVENLFPPEIERFVLACRNHGLPVKLYVVVRAGQVTAYDAKALKFAKENGVGILEVTPPSQGALISGSPVSQSLGGLRSFDLSVFPSKYREPLKQAIETFRTGNPAKGCSDVYDELEQLTRRLGKKCGARSGALKQTPTFNWDVEPWAKILEFLKQNLDKRAAGTPQLTNQFFSRLIGLTEHRNDTGHKPASLAKKIQRDSELRTRFEVAMDELGKLIVATKSLRL
ncbi:MAG: hypothetical protein ACK5UX_02645 [Burkholderiales bacterium]